MIRSVAAVQLQSIAAVQLQSIAAVQLQRSGVHEAKKKPLTLLSGALSKLLLIDGKGLDHYL
jgi:hypothetical protein